MISSKRHSSINETSMTERRDSRKAHPSPKIIRETDCTGKKQPDMMFETKNIYTSPIV